MGKSKIVVDFNYNVFINCPFDKEYTPLLKSIIFCLIKLGLQPKIALVSNDGSEVRFEKIRKMIEESDFSIHDLSRHKSNKVGEYYRLNMPFELGFDIGNKLYKNSNKKILILESEEYSVQKALSDLAFSDCRCHNSDLEEAIYVIREWFYENTNHIVLMVAPNIIWDEYNYFQSYLFSTLSNEGRSHKAIDRISIKEFMDYAKDYLTIKR